MKRTTRILLSVVSGLLLSLAWLGFPGWTLFFAFIPLLVLDRYLVDNKFAFRSVSFWGHSFLAFLIWNGLTTWWIAHATLVGALMAILVNSFLMSLVFWLAHIARRNFTKNLGYIAWIVFWITFEFFHFHWEIEWPWLTLGNGFANQVKMVQWYEFTGTLGGSLWILVMNVLLFKLFVAIKQKTGSYQSRIGLVAGVLLVLFVPVIYSLFSYSSYTEKENPKNIVIVQPNV
ncbi:MAG: apolipoprotein N-acyltransferase, partial [Bacteroidia bacterium]|nr:apolipoprotein N-acyltransferase [Bacteroidia bacterium]